MNAVFLWIQDPFRSASIPTLSREWKNTFDPEVGPGRHRSWGVGTNLFW